MNNEHQAFYQNIISALQEKNIEKYNNILRIDYYRHMLEDLPNKELTNLLWMTFYATLSTQINPNKIIAKINNKEVLSAFTDELLRWGNTTKKEIFAELIHIRLSKLNKNIHAAKRKAPSHEDENQAKKVKFTHEQSLTKAATSSGPLSSPQSSSVDTLSYPYESSEETTSLFTNQEIIDVDESTEQDNNIETNYNPWDDIVERYSQSQFLSFFNHVRAPSPENEYQHQHSKLSDSEDKIGPEIEFHRRIQ